MADRVSYLEYVKATTRLFDTDGGAARMGLHQLAALKEVRPDLHARLLETDLVPLEDDYASPELERWIGEHWRDAE